MTAFAGEQPETLTLATDSDVVIARRRVRERTAGLDFDMVTQTKIVTAASELARNTVIHGKGGDLTIDVVRDPGNLRDRTGLRLTFVDHGPGIADIDLAMTGGWSTRGGLGLGLSGSRRLVNEFDLTSVPDSGTRVTVVMWRREP